MQQPVLQALRWMRFVGDTVFLVGVAAFVAFIAGVFGRRPAPVPGVEVSSRPEGTMSKSPA